MPSPSCASSTSVMPRSSLRIPVRTHAQIERIVGQVVAAGAVPVVLGGDHSITEPDVRAVAARYGPVGLVHFDTHTDTGTEVFDVELSHGTPMYRLVRDGHVAGSRYVQIGLRYQDVAERLGTTEGAVKKMVYGCGAATVICSGKRSR